MSNNQISPLPHLYPVRRPGPFEAARSGEERGVYSPRPKVSTAFLRNLQRPHFSTPINTLSAIRRGFLKAVYQVSSITRRRYLCPRLYDVNRVTQKLAAPETNQPTDTKRSVGARCASAPLGKSPDRRRRRDYMYFALVCNRVGRFFFGTRIRLAGKDSPARSRQP